MIQVNIPDEDLYPMVLAELIYGEAEKLSRSSGSWTDDDKILFGALIDILNANKILTDQLSTFEVLELLLKADSLGIRKIPEEEESA